MFILFVKSEENTESMSSEEQDVVWEPFGGLFSASLAANMLNRKAFACEIDDTYFYYGVKRFSQVAHQYSLFLTQLAVEPFSR